MSPPGPSDVCTVYRLRMVTRRATRLYDRHLAPTGLGIAQFGLLNAIWSRAGASVTDIAALLDMERTTLTRNLGPLVRRGFVALGAGPDKRSRSVTVTAAGKEAVRNARPYWRAAQAELASALGEERHAALVAALGLALAHIPDTEEPRGGNLPSDLVT